MSSLALMRLLESAPQRYDAGMQLLTFGAASRIHEALAGEAARQPGWRILEIGCGTGAVTERLIARDAVVTAIDQNPDMLAQAMARLGEAPPGSVTWVERTASEIDRLPEETFDSVVASLSLSEMSRDERRFVLRQATRRLRPGGVLVAADETVPRSPWKRGLYAMLRGPQALLAWLFVDSVSRPIKDLAGEVRDAGLEVRAERRWLFETLAMVVAERPR